MKKSQIINYNDKTFFMVIQNEGYITVFDLSHLKGQTKSYTMEELQKVPPIEGVSWTVRGVNGKLNKSDASQITIFRDIQYSNFMDWRRVTGATNGKPGTNFDYWYIMAQNTIFGFQVDPTGNAFYQMSYDILLGSSDTTPSTVTAYANEVSV